MEDDESEKEFDASQRKLDEARKRGEVVKSQDVAQTLLLAAATIIFLTIGGRIAGEFIVYFRGFIENSGTLQLDSGSTLRLSAAVAIKVMVVMGLFFGVLMVVAIAGHAGQTGLMFSTERLAWKFDKINPIKGFKRLFGGEALVQFLKTLLKVIILGAAAYFVLKPYSEEAELMIGLDPHAFSMLLGEIFKKLLIQLLIILGIFAGADYFVQRFQFYRRQRMTKQEIKEEYRQTEGDPMVAAKLKRIRMERGRRRMMQNVAKASVVITNPTHFAVALRYVPGETNAPICVAKGTDRVALKIREIATENDVPIIENPPLARALFKEVEVDEPIPFDFYQAVAKIIGVIMQVAAKKRPKSALRELSYVE